MYYTCQSFELFSSKRIEKKKISEFDLEMDFLKKLFEHQRVLNVRKGHVYKQTLPSTYIKAIFRLYTSSWNFTSQNFNRNFMNTYFEFFSKNRIKNPFCFLNWTDSETGRPELLSDMHFRHVGWKVAE